MGWRGGTPASGLALYVKQTVVVHTRDGQSLQGVLAGAYEDCVVLWHAVDLEADTGLKGQVIVPRPNVSYLQAVEAE